MDEIIGLVCSKKLVETGHTHIEGFPPIIAIEPLQSAEQIHDRWCDDTNLMLGSLPDVEASVLDLISSMWVSVFVLSIVNVVVLLSEQIVLAVSEWKGFSVEYQFRLNISTEVIVGDDIFDHMSCKLEQGAKLTTRDVDKLYVFYSHECFNERCHTCSMRNCTWSFAIEVYSEIPTAGGTTIAFQLINFSYFLTQWINTMRAVTWGGGG